MLYPNLKSNPQIDYQRALQNENNFKASEDISKIEHLLLTMTASEEQLKDLHIELDGKYQACIINWPLGLRGYNKTYGFIYEDMDEDIFKFNLQLMKSKLEGFKNGWNDSNKVVQNSDHTSDVNVTVNNNINVNITFTETKKKIEEMTALSREQTDEILEKINELENIYKENISRKNKWEKVKPIISFVMDKGADVAVAILTLIVQMKLGL